MNQTTLKQSPRTTRRVIRSIKAKSDAKRTFAERSTDRLTRIFGSFPFFAANALWFGLWLSINLGWMPGIQPFDPFPFNLLTTVVSLEAIALSIIVLASQNRVARLYDVREEMDLQVDIITEQELTKIMELVVKLAEKQGIAVAHDTVLHEMLKPMDTEKIEKALERQV